MPGRKLEISPDSYETLARLLWLSQMRQPHCLELVLWIRAPEIRLWSSEWNKTFLKQSRMVQESRKQWAQSPDTKSRICIRTRFRLFWAFFVSGTGLGPVHCVSPPKMLSLTVSELFLIILIHLRQDPSPQSQINAPKRWNILVQNENAEQSTYWGECSANRDRLHSWITCKPETGVFLLP